MHIVWLPPREAGSVRPKKERVILIRYSAKMPLAVTAYIKPIMSARLNSYLFPGGSHRTLLPRFNMLKFLLAI